MKRLMIVLLALLVVGCTDGPGARRVLEQNGYKDITIKGYALWSCSNSDNYATKFTARSPNGQAVSGAVCRGFLKGSTIRFD